MLLRYSGGMQPRSSFRSCRVLWTCGGRRALASIAFLSLLLRVSFLCVLILLQGIIAEVTVGDKEQGEDILQKLQT